MSLIRGPAIALPGKGKNKVVCMGFDGGGAQAAFSLFDPPPLTLCVSLQCDFVGSFIEIIKVFIIKLLISILTTKSQYFPPSLPTGFNQLSRKTDDISWERPARPRRGRGLAAHSRHHGVNGIAARSPPRLA